MKKFVFQRPEQQETKENYPLTAFFVDKELVAPNRQVSTLEKSPLINGLAGRLSWGKHGKISMETGVPSGMVIACPHIYCNLGCDFPFGS